MREVALIRALCNLRNLWILNLATDSDITILSAQFFQFPLWSKR
jgi:hypothetical protein